MSETPNNLGAYIWSLAECERVQQMNLPEEAQEKLLLHATGGSKKLAKALESS